MFIDTILNYITESIQDFLYLLPIVIIALTVHEFSHAYASYKLGDYTAKAQGRLTLNPLKHIDPIGFIFLLVFRFGWAKPVPVRTLYFKNPKRDMALTALAGPISNFLLAFVGVFMLAFCDPTIINGISYFGRFEILAQFSYLFILLNISLAIFNLIPFPPLDGSRVLMWLLPARYYIKVAELERYSFIVLLILVYFNVFDTIVVFFVQPLVNSYIALAQLLGGLL